MRPKAKHLVSEAIDDHADIHFFSRLFSVLHAGASPLMRNLFASRELLKFASAFACGNMLGHRRFSFGLPSIHDKHRAPIDPQSVPARSLNSLDFPAVLRMAASDGDNMNLRRETC